MTKHFKFITIGLFILALSYLGYNMLYPHSPQLVGYTKQTGTPTIGGIFTLTNMTGDTVTEKDLLGKYSLIYFGFTNCPDICPTSLQNIALAMEALPKPQQDQIQPIFITLDPERDKPRHLKEYVTYFHPRFWGLSGTKQQIKQAAKAYRIYYKIAEHEPGQDYSVDHSGYLYLMGPDGQFMTHFNHDSSDTEIIKKLQEIMSL